jgi:hypothetical protein
VTGSLTVCRRTRPLSFDAKVSAAAGEVRLDAQVPVNRADFGLTYSPLSLLPVPPIAAGSASRAGGSKGRAAPAQRRRRHPYLGMIIINMLLHRA